MMDKKTKPTKFTELNDKDKDLTMFTIMNLTLAKEDGDKGDEEQEDGGEVGGQQLCGDLPLQLQGHVHHVIFLG